MIDALGVRLRLRCDRDLDRAKRDWARCAAQGTDDVGPEVLGHGARALETAVTARLITESTGKLHLWHAAGVSLPDGRVLVLVAPSGTGKTTAAVRLSQSGWGYVTDETVGVTMDGRVLPYPKPVALLEDGVKEVVGPDDLGLAHHAENLTLGRVVVLERTEDAQSPSLTRLPLLEGLQTLLAQSSGLVQLPEPLASTCRLIDRVGGIYRLTYAELASAAPLLRALMAKGPDAVETWLHRPPSPPAQRSARVTWATWCELPGSTRSAAQTRSFSWWARSPCGCQESAQASGRHSIGRGRWMSSSPS